MFTWQQLEDTLKHLIYTARSFIKARRREEASITIGALLIWAGIYFSDGLAKIDPEGVFQSWHVDKIGKIILIVIGAGLVLYGGIKILRLVYAPDLPPLRIVLQLSKGLWLSQRTTENCFES